MTIKKAARELVIQRANSRCEYCRLLDIVSVHSFHIDHIIAVKHDGTDDVDNLAWSCLNCNLHKGTDTGSFDRETGNFVFFYNPRKDTWSEHFTLANYQIIGKTPAGQVTVRLFQMNNEQ